MSKNRLSQEETENLKDFLTHDALKALVKLMELASEEIGMDVLRIDLTTPENERKLIHAKLRHEGAAKLLWAVRQRLEALKAKQES